MTDSIFTKILNGEISGYKFYEDDDFFCILDIFPKCKGHSLIITKKQYADIFEVPEETIMKIGSLSKKIALILKETFDAEGIKILQNNGKASGQEVFHYHMHVIPYFESNEKNINKEKFEEVYNQIVEKINAN